MVGLCAPVLAGMGLRIQPRSFGGVTAADAAPGASAAALVWLEISERARNCVNTDKRAGQEFRSVWQLAQCLKACWLQQLG